MADSPPPSPSSPDPDWARFARYLAGESDAAERMEVERELARHPDRARLIGALDTTTRPPTSPDLSDADVERALAAVLAERGATVTPLTPGRRWRAVTIRAAAAVIAVAGAAYLWRTAAAIQRPAGPAWRLYGTGVGSLDSLRLPDGTRVVLGPSSTLRIDSTTYGASRVVALHGQALFEVVHDSAHPFVVQAGAAELRDVGTRFSVESVDGGATRVAVVEGAVAVATRGAVVAMDTLHAGDRGIVSPDFAVQLSRGAASTEDLAWLDQRLVFHDAPIAQVAADLQRWYGLELVVRDSTLARRHLTVTLDASMRSEVGRLLGAVLGASVVQRGDTIQLEPIAGPVTR